MRTTWVALVVIAVLVIGAVVVLWVSDRGGETERPPATSAAATPASAKSDPKAGRPSPAVKKRELPKEGNADLLRKIVKAVAEAPPSGEAIDEKALDERLAAIRKDYSERLARVRSRARRNRPVVRGEGEPGNAWDYYRQALARIAEMTEEERNLVGTFSDADRNEGTPEEEKERKQKVEEVLEKYGSDVALIQKGIVQSSVEKDIEYEKGFDLILPYVGESITASQLMVGVSKALAEYGAHDEALAIYLDAMQFSRDVGRDGPLISALVDILNESMLFEAGARIINSPVGEESLRKFLAESTVVMGNQPSLSETMDVELVLVEAAMLALVDQPDEFTKYLGGEKRMSGDPIILNILLVEGMGEYIEYVRRTQEQNNRPAEQDIWKTLNAPSLEEMCHSGNPFLKLVLPSITGAYAEFYKSRARLQEIHLAAAVKLYQQEYGTFPDHLEHLVSTGIVSSVPVDPFSGEPFRYVRSEDGSTVTIYSIGENLVDNKGADRESGEENDDVGVTIKTPERK